MGATPAVVTRLAFEHLREPLGIGESRPRISWQIASAAAGWSQDAYEVYPVTMGATTIWERWDSLMPDGRLNPGDMLSFNHYALGAVADWLHRTVAGLAPAEPGYRRILVAPQPGGGLEHASAAHETPYGRAEVSWQRAGGRLDLDVTVPPGCTAEVRLPGAGRPNELVGSGTHHFSGPFRAPQDDPPRPAAKSSLGLAPETETGLFEA